MKKALILIGSVIGISIGAWILFMPKQNVRLATVNGEAKFSYAMGNNARIVTKELDGVSKEFYEAQLDGHRTIAATVFVPTKPQSADIGCGTKPSFLANIAGDAHRVCNAGNVLYAANFSSAGTWYSVAVMPGKGTASLSQIEAARLLESIQAP